MRRGLGFRGAAEWSFIGAALELEARPRAGGFRRPSWNTWARVQSGSVCVGVVADNRAGRGQRRTRRAGGGMRGKKNRVGAVKWGRAVSDNG